MTSYTVFLLYPDYLTGDFGADIYVDSAEAEDAYNAVPIVQQRAVDALESPVPLDDFRCVAVIAGEHELELDATCF